MSVDLENAMYVKKLRANFIVWAFLLAVALGRRGGLIKPRNGGDQSLTRPNGGLEEMYKFAFVHVKNLFFLSGGLFLSL